MKRLTAVLAVAISFGLFILACDNGPTGPDAANPSTSADETAQGPPGGGGNGGSGNSFTFDSPVFDIEAAPNGNILVAETVFGGVDSGPTTIWELLNQGNQSGKKEVVKFTTPGGITPINGLAARGQHNMYATRGGLDLAENAAVLQVTSAGAEVVADIEAFETENDPDLFAFGDEKSEGYKDPKCAPASGPFTPGAQSNPYHLTRTSGNTVLVGDAAGNTLLRVRQNGDIEVVALFTPPTEDGGASLDMDNWLEFPYNGPDEEPGTDDDPTQGDCFVQPVPNAVATADDGTIYVGELTGVDFTAPQLTPLEESRVWRIDPGAQGVTCPSEECEVAFTGFTSIIDVAFGPGGDLFVVENDENGWLTSVEPIPSAGGTVNRCDLDNEECKPFGDTEEGDFTFPAAITFDKWDDLWLLENSLAAPTVKKVE